MVKNGCKPQALLVKYGMGKFISHYSAALYWQVQGMDLIFSPDQDELELLHFTYFEQAKRCKAKGQKAYLCGKKLPSGAILTINGEKIASPELMFFQLANKLDIHRLILLGLQLCAIPDSDDKPSTSITTKQKLKSFANKMKGRHGYRKSMEAIKYIEDGSASVMESVTFMVLTLPHRLGGYGLKGINFNFEVVLNKELRKRLRKSRYFIDLYYKSEKLGVEYDSNAHHNGPSEQGKDALRAAVLERLGITMLSMRSVQLFNKDGCEDFAYNLAKRLGRRIRIRSTKFVPMQKRLRQLFLDNREMEYSQFNQLAAKPVCYNVSSQQNRRL